MRIYAQIAFLSLVMVAANAFAQSPDYYMQELIKIAQTQPSAPFAAAIVHEKTGKVLCQGLNDSVHNPTHHGEMVAINNCVKKYPQMNWSETTLYTTAEPCVMCQGAIIWAGIPKVVYGTSIPSLKKYGWYQIPIRAKEIASKASFYHGKVVGDVLSNETDKLFMKGEIKR